MPRNARNKPSAILFKLSKHPLPLPSLLFQEDPEYLAQTQTLSSAYTTERMELLLALAQRYNVEPEAALLNPIVQKMAADLFPAFRSPQKRSNRQWYAETDFILYCEIKEHQGNGMTVMDACRFLLTTNRWKSIFTSRTGGSIDSLARKMSDRFYTAKKSSYVRFIENLLDAHPELPVKQMWNGMFDCVLELCLEKQILPE